MNSIIQTAISYILKKGGNNKGKEIDEPKDS